MGKAGVERKKRRGLSDVMTRKDVLTTSPRRHIENRTIGIEKRHREEN